MTSDFIGNLQKSTGNLGRIHNVSSHLGFHNLIASRMNPGLINGLPLLGPLPMEGPNFTLVVDLGRVEVVIPQQVSGVVGNLAIPEGVEDNPTSERTLYPIFPNSSAVSVITPSSRSPSTVRPRGRRGRPAKSSGAQRAGSQATSSSFVGASPSVSSLVNRPSSQPSVDQSSSQSGYGVITRARRALSLGASVGVVLDCPEEEALASLCDQISSHLPNP